MKRTPPPRIIHQCPTCTRLSSLAPDAEKICLTCGVEAVEVGNELPFDMKLDFNNLPSLRMEFIPHFKASVISDVLEMLGMKFSYQYNCVEHGFLDLRAWPESKQYEPDNSVLVTHADIEELAAEKQSNSWHELLAKSKDTQVEVDPERQPIGINTSEQVANQYNEANPVIFVYQKDGATKALSFHEAKEQATKFEADGWAHVATLDAKVFVEHHYNNR